MPIVVEALNEVTYQDQHDLQKIYLDAPDWLLAPQQSPEQLVESLLHEGSLIAARFNDRLLGAARLERTPDIWHLSHLCVRKITRRRGVAERMVHEAQRHARQAGAQLRLCVPAGQPEAQALAAKLHLSVDVL